MTMLHCDLHQILLRNCIFTKRRISSLCVGTVRALPSTMVRLSLMIYFKGTGKESVCVLKWSLLGCD